MTDKQREDLTEDLKKQAELEREIGSSIEAYLDKMKEYKKILSEINKNRKREAELAKIIEDAGASGNEEAQIKLGILKNQTSLMEKQAAINGNALASISKQGLVSAKIFGGLGKAIAGLPQTIKKVYSSLQASKLFDLDKAIKQSALSMGVLSGQSGGFRTTIKAASFETNKIGIGIEKMAKMQSDYSEELGRSVQLSSDSLIAMGRLAAATALGVEGASKLSAEMDQQGLSAQKTSEFIEQAMNDASAMGLNASKVVKNIANNTKMLNRYNFQGGVKGLATMAKTVAKLGVGMEFASNFADKLFNVEGAVDMSAQLQVMGGEWAKLGDPFRLMYMARNDMAGLTKELGNAAAASAHFNENGEIQIGAKEMHKLRIIAEQTGASYDDLVTAGKNAFKLKSIGSQIFAGASDEEREFISNMSEINDGKATVMINSSPTLINQLNKGTVNALMKEQESLNERAKNARTFDDALNNTINGIKQFLLPIIEVMNTKLIPKLDSFVDRFEKGKFGEKIEKIATVVGEFISVVGGFMIDNPIKSAIALFLADKLKWISSGMLLGTGFNKVASVGGAPGGDITDALSNGRGNGKGFNMKRTTDAFKGGGMKGGMKSLGRQASSSMKGLGGGKGLLKGLGKASGVLSIAGAGMDGYENLTSDKLDTGEALAKTLDQNKFMASGAAIGALFGGVGAIPGAGIGALIDWAVNSAGGDDALIGNHIGSGYGDKGQALNDGIIGSPTNKLGSDFSKGRGIIQGGKITPIDNKDDLLAMKPGGIVDQVSKNQGSTVITHKFDDLKVSGEIKITIPDNPGIAIDLMKDPNFVREITVAIQSQLERNINGGKNKG